jgi:hypothetical protein
MVVTGKDILSVLSREHTVTYCGYLADFDSALPVYVSTSEKVDRPTELVELLGEHFILTGRFPVRKKGSPYRGSGDTSPLIFSLGPGLRWLALPYYERSYSVCRLLE